MNILHTEQYRLAFGQYLRQGTPIRLTFKEQHPTRQYVWRTQADARVRPEHAANEGRLFSWDSPPATGHPGRDYNCRCEAVPYVAGETEYAGHEIIGSLASSSGKWAIADFFRHSYHGEGAGVTLSQIGHLRDIVEQHAYYDGGEGAQSRLTNQIIGKARQTRQGALFVPFDQPYQFEYANLPESIPHGHAVVEGEFIGSVIDRGTYLAINGEIRFRFSDMFTDPFEFRDTVAWLRERPGEFRELMDEVARLVGFGPEVIYEAEQIDPDDVPEWFYQLSEFGGTAYPITGSWRSEFGAEILKDASISRY